MNRSMCQSVWAVRLIQVKYIIQLEPSSEETGGENDPKNASEAKPLLTPFAIMCRLTFNSLHQFCSITLCWSC